ncbi:hypothetical protein, partial [Microbispora rosea]
MTGGQGEGVGLAGSGVVVSGGVVLGVTGGADFVCGADEGRREADGVTTGGCCVTDAGEHVGGRAASGSITPAWGVGVTQ